MEDTLDHVMSCARNIQTQLMGPRWPSIKTQDEKSHNVMARLVKAVRHNAGTEDPTQPATLVQQHVLSGLRDEI